VASEKGVALAALLVKAAICGSNSEASRLIEGGGVQIEGQKINYKKFKLDLESGKSFLLKAGKKVFMKVKVL
jgi:tyrosyl-tRNA synthetase